MPGPRAADGLRFKKEPPRYGSGKKQWIWNCGLDFPPCELLASESPGCGFHAQFASLLPTNAYSLPPLPTPATILTIPIEAKLKSQYCVWAVWDSDFLASLGSRTPSGKDHLRHRRQQCGRTRPS